MYKDKEYLKDLVKRCINRERDAWDKFVKEVSFLIFYIIKDKFRRLGLHYKKEEIENLKQDIFLSLWEKNTLETINNKDNVIPWLCAYATNAASNYLRALRRTADSPNDEPLGDSYGSPLSSPLEELSNKDMQDGIERALNSLNSKENLIIKLSLLYQKRYREIATMLNMPLGTVLVYAKRAKDKLRKDLKKYL